MSVALIAERTLPPLPQRPQHGHKGTFGTVLVVAGHMTMIGAPCFVTSGALRIGCGLVRLAVPPEILTTCLGIVPSAIGIPRDAAHVQVMAGIDERTVLAAGPGLGLGATEEGLIRKLLMVNRPLVLDGDGLTHLSRLAGVRLSRLSRELRSRQSPLILTPHPCEFAQLAAAWGTTALSDDPSDRERRMVAQELAQVTKSIVVLKGHGTVVSDGADTWTCAVGNSALAIPGSGDVLTGVIAGLLSQGVSPHDAAILGVQLHGMAGDRWVEQRPFGMLALELAALIPEVARIYRAT